MTTARLIITTAVLAALAAAELDAQRGRRGRGGRPQAAVQPAPKPPEESKPVESWVAVQGADVYIGNGSMLRRATILIGDDKIHAVGQDVDIPEGATILDASGKFVSPGFVIVKATGMGAPSGGGFGGRGGRGGGGGGGGDESSIADSVNPFDPSIKLGLAAGITSFCTLSQPGTSSVGGRSAVIKLDYGNLKGMVVKEGSVAAMRVPLDRQEMKAFRGLVRQARDYKKTLSEGTAAASTGQRQQTPKPPRGTETILKIIDGDVKLWISLGGGGGGRRGGRGGGGGGPSTSETELLSQALEVSDMLGVGIVLDNPVTAWTMPDEIAATGSMAILSPRSKEAADPGNPEVTGSNIASASILSEVGVPVAVTTPSGRFGGSGVGTGGILGQDLNTPHIDAAYAVRGGMDNRKALRTITLDSAKIIGADDRIGSIEVGKDADLLILDGDPLHYKTFVEIAIVNGKVVYEKDKEPFYSHIKR